MNKLTKAQQHNLDAVRSAGGALVARRNGYFARGSITPIRGLSGVALRSLVRMGLLKRSACLGHNLFEVV